MTTKPILGTALSILLALSSPSVFADKGKGGHGRGHGHGGKAKFDNRDLDRDFRRTRVRAVSVRDPRFVTVRNSRVVSVRRPTLVRQRTFVVDRSGMRFRGLDTNRNGIITRREWRGNSNSFRVHDTNGDGILSGREVHLYGRRR